MNINIPRSPVIAAWEWTGDRLSYADPAVKGDTYPLTWADDDAIYASAEAGKEVAIL